jgi:hypothetical protein
MTLRSPDGIRLVCEVLELSGLGDLLAGSYGSVRAMANRMQTEVLDFDKAQRARLAARMAPKKITVCQDETFHPEICLVAMEPASNFILLEAYAERRDADTWTNHGLHRLSRNKLATLTAVHNYYVTREDGTTAAERFFGVPADDLFEHLVERMPPPPRPARKRLAATQAPTMPTERELAA